MLTALAYSNNQLQQVVGDWNFAHLLPHTFNGNGIYGHELFFILCFLCPRKVKAVQAPFNGLKLQK